MRTRTIPTGVLVSILSAMVIQAEGQTTQPATTRPAESDQQQLLTRLQRAAAARATEPTPQPVSPYQQYTPYQGYSGRSFPSQSLYSGQPMYPHYYNPVEARYYYSAYTNRRFDNYGQYTAQLQSRRYYGRAPVNRISYGTYDHDYDYNRYNNANWGQRYDPRGYNPYDLQRNNRYASSTRGLNQTTMQGGRYFNPTPQFSSTQKPRQARPTQAAMPGTVYPRPVYPSGQR